MLIKCWLVFVCLVEGVGPGWFGWDWSGWLVWSVGHTQDTPRAFVCLYCAAPRRARLTCALSKLLLYSTHHCPLLLLWLVRSGGENGIWNNLEVCVCVNEGSSDDGRGWRKRVSGGIGVSDEG